MKTPDEVTKWVAELVEDSGIPDHMREGVTEYVLRGNIPGSFLELILRNDFAHAAQVADYMNRHALLAYARLLYMLPSTCWGSAEALVAWDDEGGLLGMIAERQAAKP